MPDADLRGSAVIHNFVDEKLLAGISPPTGVQGISAGISLHIAGRLDEPKGIRQFLDLLMPRLPIDWQVNVYGDGPLRQSIEQRHQHAQLRIHGHQLYGDVVLATKSATVVVVPSICEEACGTVLLEALRLGKMCFALDRGGTPELIRYGAPGQLRLYGNLTTLVNGLLSEGDFHCDQGGAPADVNRHIEALMPIYQREHHVG
jgi:glycosyltransferase involved in cell wall biosynthesis